MAKTLGVLFRLFPSREGIKQSERRPIQCRTCWPHDDDFPRRWLVVHLRRPVQTSHILRGNPITLIIGRHGIGSRGKRYGLCKRFLLLLLSWLNLALFADRNSRRENQ